MAHKIYIGDQEITTGGGSGGSLNASDFVDVSTWNDHEKVIASALINLKGIEKQIEAFDESIQAQETALLAEVHVVEQTKADVSVVYTKDEIDQSDKVVAAALASLNERVTTAEASIGSMSSEQFDPTSLKTELADVSAKIEFCGDLILDVSSRVDVLESNDYIDSATLDASLNEFTYSKDRIDASLAQISSGGSGSISGNVLQYVEVTQNGLMFVDASMNIGVVIDSSGLHAPNIVEFNEIS